MWYLRILGANHWQNFWFTGFRKFPGSRNLKLEGLKGLENPENRLMDHRMTQHCSSMV